MNTDFDAEKYREARYKEACDALNKLEKKLDKKRLADAHAKLDNVRERVRAGDRKSMLELIKVTADTLLILDSLPPELQASLANGLKEVVNVLRPSRGLLPRRTRGRGERSEVKKRHQESKEFWAAMGVEYYRFKCGLSLDEAEAQVAEEFQIKQDLVHKRWKRAHRRAKPQVDMIRNIFMQIGVEPPIRRKKKVR